MNEILAQTGQLIDRGHSPAQKNFLNAVSSCLRKSDPRFGDVYDKWIHKAATAQKKPVQKKEVHTYDKNLYKSLGHILKAHPTKEKPTKQLSMCMFV